MSAAPCRAELVIRGRRSLLTDSGKLALDAHLADCESCRIDHELFTELEDESAVEIRDGARIERLAARARTWARGQQGRGRVARTGRTRPWAAAAALLCLAGSAAAATWWMARPAPTAPPPPTAVPVRPQPVAGAGGPALAPPPASPALAPPSQEASPGGSAHPAGSARAARVAPALTATVLLRLAGEARRSGDVERALGFYRRLQSDFAASPEALLAKVALGTMLVERGRAREALAQFDRYLEAAPHGVLLPEALYGRARALTALGDGAAADLAWQRLLRDFPGSAYAPLARRRIAEPR